MAQKPQNYSNHARQRPLYWLVYLIFFFNVVWTVRRVILAPSTDTVLAATMAVAFVLLAFYARAFALTVQDRVIRLEMRLRMRELLPAAMQPRIADFTTGQLVALRFACDAELPALAEKVLRDGIQSKTAIKKMVAAWNADHLRA